MNLILDGRSLSLEAIFEFLDDPKAQVAIAPVARLAMAHAHAQVGELDRNSRRALYGVHTGLGKLKDFRIRREDQAAFQMRILRSHAAGVGPSFEDSVSRLALLLRANVLCGARSGVRPELADRLIALLNAGVHPLLRQIGSLGVGDLQPMAQVGLCLAGLPEGLARVGGETLPAPEALTKVGLAVEFELGARESLALMSGSTVLLAVALLALRQTQRLLDVADATLALSLEALRGELGAFDARVHAARGVQGQCDSAANVRRLTQGSQFLQGGVLASNRPGSETHRVQDPVSFRASPQVHGAARDAMSYVTSVLERELNAATDNPLFFETREGVFEGLSGGNFHGALLGYAMDLLSIVLTDLAVLSERRSARLLDPDLSFGLPSNLVADSPGLNTGFALIQASATALVSEMRVLATPASVGSIPTKSNQEDHNGMGMTAARKALQVVEYLEMVLAIEWLCAAQGVDLVRRLTAETIELGVGTGAIHALLRQRVPMALEDRFAGDMIDEALDLLRSDEFAKALRASDAYLSVEMREARGA